MSNAATPAVATARKRISITGRQILLIIGLTVTYLAFELAFNATLLDVVGSATNAQDIHAIETYGRMLSGVAVALVVFQLLLPLHNRTGQGGESTFLLTFLPGLAAVATFFLLQQIVNAAVDRTNAEFRRASATVSIVQRAMVEGKVDLQGLASGAEVFKQPEGKAFLATFPLMALSVERLEEKVSAATLELVKREISSRMGGPDRYYENYRKAMLNLSEQYKRYEVVDNIDVNAQHQADVAWNDYVATLAEKGWTPTNIPGRARTQVIRNVRAKVAVPYDWEPYDEGAFRDAVKHTYLSKAKGAKDGVRVRGQLLPRGLSFQGFAGHPAVQDELRERLKYPQGIRLRTNYSQAALEREVFDPIVREEARKVIQRNTAPVETYEPEGVNYAYGTDAARAVIVAPMALGFSLLGAIAHLGKLFALLIKGAGMLVPPLARLSPWSWLAPVGVIIGAWVTLSSMTNPVASSRLYGFLQEQVSSGAQWHAKPLANALHVVAVGQGYMYPFNEDIRVKVLGGLSFGQKGL